MVIAHRGASGYRPEHTRAAYELAFALGADAVEPDIVATKDGVLVIRHENQIGETTDVASRPEFAALRTTKIIDGQKLTGWFTEDFTWAQLSTLRAVERLPQLRQASSTFNGAEGILRLSDLQEIIDGASEQRMRQLVMVAEIKHATYFESIGLPLDDLFASEIAQWATAENLIVESFEESALQKIRRRGTLGRLVFLAEASGAPADLVARDGLKAKSYEQLVGPSGLSVFCWTLRAENKFLGKNFRRGGNASDYGNWLAEFSRILASGVDGVFADQPDLALAAIESAASAEGAGGDA